MKPRGSHSLIRQTNITMLVLVHKTSSKSNLFIQFRLINEISFLKADAFSIPDLFIRPRYIYIHVQCFTSCTGKNRFD